MVHSTFKTVFPNTYSTLKSPIRFLNVVFKAVHSCHMSVDDLAIDVGFAIHTDEYTSFVECIRNILDGCTYGRDVTRRIIQKCQQSELDIARRVIRKCRQRGRKEEPKWWQTYTKKKSSSEPYGKQPRRPPKRRMNLTFRRKETKHTYERRSEPKRRPERYQRRRKRPASPVSSPIPTWPSDEYETSSPRRNKRKRYSYRQR